MSIVLDTRELQERLEKLTARKEAVETTQSIVDELMTSDLAAAEPDFDEKLDEARTDLDEAAESFDQDAQDELLSWKLQEKIK